MPGKAIVVVKPAVLPFRFADPRFMFPLATKLTLPVGVLDPVIVAVKVTCVCVATFAALDSTPVEVGLADGCVPPPPPPLVDELLLHPRARLIAEMMMRPVAARQPREPPAPPQTRRLASPAR